MNTTELKKLAKPQPLSDEQIKSAIYKQCPDFDEWYEGPSIDDVIAIVKAAHGITKEWPC